jgi:hypothetical protein
MTVKTWADIERAAREDPFLHQAVTLVERGDVTRIEALCTVALALVDANNGMQAQMLDLINTRVPTIFVVPYDLR